MKKILNVKTLQNYKDEDNDVNKIQNAKNNSVTLESKNL